jgi:hypothetical protein
MVSGAEVIKFFAEEALEEWEAKYRTFVVEEEE